MRHVSPEELKKMGTFVFQRAEAVPHLIEEFKEGLKDRPEGKEMVFLKNVLEHYIKDRDNFLAQFVSGKPGSRGVDRLISGLEHPQSEIRPDRKLIKKLRKLARKMDRMDLPDIEELHHYERLKQDVSRMSTLPDIHEFIRRFNNLMIRAVKYRYTDVARAIRSQSAKETPAIIRLENFEFTLGIWKLLLSRLYWPAIEGRVKPIIGSFSPEDTMGLMARKLKMSPDAVQREVRECFPKGRETGNMDNIRAFAKKVNSERDKNIFARALAIAGDKKRASMLVGLFGKKGDVVVNQKKTVMVIGGMTRKLNSDTAKDDIELAAKKELQVMISKMLKGMYEKLDEERKRFADAVSSRIRELEKRNEKILSKLRSIEKRMKKRDVTTLMSAAGAGSVARRMMALLKMRRDYYVRAADILKLMRVRMLLTQYMMGSITHDEMNLGLRDIREKNPSKFVTDIVGMVSDLLQMSAERRMGADDLRRRLVKIYEYIDKVAAQVPQVTSGMVRNDKKAEDLAAELEDLRNAVEISLKSEYGKRAEEMKDIRKMGLASETYRAGKTGEEQAGKAAGGRVA